RYKYYVVTFLYIMLSLFSGIHALSNTARKKSHSHDFSIMDMGSHAQASKAHASTYLKNVVILLDSHVGDWRRRLSKYSLTLSILIFLVFGDKTLGQEVNYYLRDVFETSSFLLIHHVSG
ncbi:hypothetical protein ACJX0J_017722, partial [Zea mays]